MGVNDALQLLVSGISVGTIYAILGLGYVTIFRTSKVVNFAQGDFAMLGGLGTVYLFKTLHLPYPAAATIAVVATGLVAVVLYQTVVAPLGRASIISMVMVTIGAGLFIENAALIGWGPYAFSLPGFSGDTPIRVLEDVAVMPQSLWIIAMAAVVLAVLYYVGNHTLMGKAMTATSTDHLAANLVGVSTGGMIRISFAISGCVGALAGLFLAPTVGLNYISGGVLGLKGITALTLGGWGMATGAIAGGIALGVVETFGAGFLPAGYKDAISFGVLVLILYLRPSGLLGSPEAEEFSLE